MGLYIALRSAVAFNLVHFHRHASERERSTASPLLSADGKQLQDRFLVLPLVVSLNLPVPNTSLVHSLAAAVSSSAIHSVILLECLLCSKAMLLQHNFLDIFQAELVVLVQLGDELPMGIPICCCWRPAR